FRHVGAAGDISAYRVVRPWCIINRHARLFLDVERSTDEFLRIIARDYAAGGRRRRLANLAERPTWDERERDVKNQQCDISPDHPSPLSMQCPAGRRCLNTESISDIHC